MSQNLFYAYAKNAKDDVTYRYMIVFSTRAVAEEWWRLVSTSGTPYATSVKRITPQYYTHDPSVALIPYTIISTGPAASLLPYIIFTLFPDRDGRAWEPIPLQADYLLDRHSGSLYYVRSKSNPSEFWYADPGSQHIIVSKNNQNRSRFRITLASGEKGKIMIGSDAVIITREFDSNSVGISADSQELISGQGPTSFTLDDFVNRFRVRREVPSYGANQAQDGYAIVRTEEGEVWELIN